MKLSRRRRQPSLLYALYINAGLLLAVLAVLLLRGPGLGGIARAAPEMPPIAGGGGIFLMPAQFAYNAWGCYLLDIDSQTVCAYEYLPGEKQLCFVAARSYKEDRKLTDWNTKPSIKEIARLTAMQHSEIRGAPATGAPVPGNGTPDTGDKPPDTTAPVPGNVPPPTQP